MFNFRKKPKELEITQTDREWVENNLNWLLETGGLPDSSKSQLLLNDINFPLTFKIKEFSAQNYIDDCSVLLKLEELKIVVEYQSDIRDLVNTPWAVEGDQLDVAVVNSNDGYTILIANFLKTHPKSLVYHITKQLLKIKMKKNEWNFENGNDVELFVILSSVYFRFGFIIAMNSSDYGMRYDGNWETKWDRAPEIPYEVMAFSLAYYVTCISEKNSEWTRQLSGTLKKLYLEGITLLKN